MSGVEHAVVALLRADSGVTDIVGTRITAGPLGVPDIARPYVTVQLQAVDDQHTTDNKASLARDLVSVHGIADTQNGAIALRQAIVTALNGYAGGGASVAVADGDDVVIASIRRTGMQQSPQPIGTRAYGHMIFFAVWSRGV